MKNKQAGFTLIELMIAMVVFAIGILAYLTLFTKATTARSYSAEMEAGAAAVQEVIDEVMAQSYTNIAGGSQSVQKSGVTYGCATAVNEPDSNRFKVITTIVTWADVRNRSHSLTFRSNVANYRDN